MHRIDRDALNNVDVDRVILTAFDCADRLQTRPSQVQVTAVAVLFLGICEKFKADPNDVMAVTGNLLKSNAAERSHEVAAWKLYLTHDIKRD